LRNKTNRQLFNPNLLVIICIFLSSCLFINGCQQQNKVIKVGILHSLTGTMAISERSVVDSTLLAIDEINASGGLLGRQIETVVIDGKSDWPSFAAGAEKLIKDEQVSVIFGCWTSASRKMVKEVVEKYDHLLFYPVQYEGLEQSPNIIYTGAAPNQQLTPTVKWAIENKRKRIFLAASDYIFPRAANKIMVKQIKALGASVVGEYYIPLGDDNVDNKDETIEHLQMMRTRVNRMECLLDDLLAYSRVGRVEQKIQSIKSKFVLQSLYEMSSAPDTFIFELEGNFPNFDTISVAFELVFRNLISNAIKHHDKVDGKIFALFQTLKSRDEVEGSGMGLAILKKTLELYSGNIKVQSEIGNGTCFIVAWPKVIEQTTNMDEEL